MKNFINEIFLQLKKINQQNVLTANKKNILEFFQAHLQDEVNPDCNLVPFFFFFFNLELLRKM